MFLFIILLIIISAFIIYVICYNTNSKYTYDRSRIVERKIIDDEKKVSYQIQYRNVFGRWKDLNDEFDSYNFKTYKEAYKILDGFRSKNKKYIDKVL